MQGQGREADFGRGGVCRAPASAKKEAKLDQSAYHMVLLARNNEGYKNLLKLTTIAALEGFYYKPRIDRELLEKYHEGLIATTACLGSEINSHLLRGDYDSARDACAYYGDLFGRDNYYVEIQNHNLPEQEHSNTQLLKISRELGLPVICSNDVHYLTGPDADAHDILLCIGTGSVVTDTDRLKYATQEFYLKSSQQMKDLFHKLHPRLHRKHIGNRGTLPCRTGIRARAHALPRFPRRIHAA